MGRVCTKIALGCFFSVRVPYRAPRTLRTHSQTYLTADAFVFIDHPDIVVFRVHARRADGTVVDANRRYAVAADRNSEVERIFCDRRRIADNLNAGQRETGFPMMAH
jgi:hypothetical protein